MLDIVFALLFLLVALPLAVADRACVAARDERPAGPLPRRARRPRRPHLHDIKFRTLSRDAEKRLGPYLGEELVERTRASTRASAAGYGDAARRAAAALERPARRHVVRRPAPDPAALLRAARGGAPGVLAAARRPPGPDRLRAGAPRLRDVDGGEARARPRVDRRPLGAPLPADALRDRLARAAASSRGRRRDGLHV